MTTEDTECTLVFVDMLGFADRTEQFPNRLIRSGPDEHGFEHTSTSLASNQFWLFNRILESCVFEHRLSGSVRAMLFSDCAFLEFGNSFRAGMVSVELMRKFIVGKVPVRMGIGKGTFYPSQFSTDLIGSTIITRSLFAGTAVVRAHYAEKCGGKGLRIFVHPSVEAEFNSRRLALVTPYDNAKWELDFLHESRPAQHKPSAEEDDRSLFDAVQEMKGMAPEKEQRHYLDTLEAMNRMRQKNSRPPVEDVRVRNPEVINEPQNSPPASAEEMKSLEARRTELLSLQEAMAAKSKARPNDFGVRAWWAFVIIGLLIGWMRAATVWSILLCGLAFWVAGIFFCVFVLDSAEVQSKIAISLHRLGEGRISKWLYQRALTIR